jgi:hypothetical protein
VMRRCWVIPLFAVFETYMAYAVGEELADVRGRYPGGGRGKQSRPMQLRVPCRALAVLRLASLVMSHILLVSGEKVSAQFTLRQETQTAFPMQIPVLPAPNPASSPWLITAPMCT